MANNEPTIAEVRTFFAEAYPSLRAFRDEWLLLSPESKAEIKSGIGNGTLTY